MFEKTENFDNAVEFLLLKALFYKLWSLIMSNWKIVSNCCFHAFLSEVLVNYASNMIRIRLNNCTNFWKQREFLHGLENLQKLASVGATSRLILIFFLQIKTLVEIERLCCYANGSLEYFKFNGQPSKSKRPRIRKQIALSISLQLTVLLFLLNSHLQRDV